MGSFFSSLFAPSDQSIASVFAILWNFRNTDFVAFLKSHKQCYAEAAKSGDYVKGVINYYTLMSDLITLVSGPFWHFVPMTKGLSRKQCHDKFHSTVVDCLQAKPSDKILEFGCGYGECGRQVAVRSGASVTGLTMSDAEIDGGNERIKLAHLEERCKMVQGNYHKMPFEDASFDKVFGLYTLKYSATVDVALAECARVLKPGGRLASYEILTTDSFDSTNKRHQEIMHGICYSTCMPKLWSAPEMRDAAKKAGLVMVEELDLCAPANEDQWYSCFERTGVYRFIKSRITMKGIGLLEAIRVMPEQCTEFMESCIRHPTIDFVEGGRLGIISGAVMMIWEKPAVAAKKNHFSSA